MPKEQPTLGSVLREHLKSEGIPHHQVATAAGLSQPSVTRILTGESDPPFGTLMRILGGLGLSLRWLHDRGVRPQGE